MLNWKTYDPQILITVLVKTVSDLKKERKHSTMGATKTSVQARLDTYESQKAGNKSYSLRTDLSLHIIQRHKSNYIKLNY